MVDGLGVVGQLWREPKCSLSSLSPITLVILNLVDNALKYAADGRYVDVALARSPGAVDNFVEAAQDDRGGRGETAAHRHDLRDRVQAGGVRRAIGPAVDSERRLHDR